MRSGAPCPIRPAAAPPSLEPTSAHGLAVLTPGDGDASLASHHNAADAAARLFIVGCAGALFRQPPSKPSTARHCTALQHCRRTAPHRTLAAAPVQGGPGNTNTQLKGPVTPGSSHSRPAGSARRRGAWSPFPARTACPGLRAATPRPARPEGVASLTYYST